MFWQITIRAILGVALAGVGYFLIDQWLPPVQFLGSQKTLPALVIVTLGGIGVFLVPAVSAVAKRLFFSFVRVLARELLALVPFPKLGRSEKVTTKSYHNPLILDTSAIIDGRIAEIAKTGFLDGTLLVPKFILGELQHIADSADPLRRGRGRRGFEVIEDLGKIGGDLKLEISDLDFPRVKKADDKLLQIGKKLKAKVVTTDYNLNKVGKLSGVKILNVNELANSIKSVLLPGETISVKVMQMGKEREQGVGYLPDGTMIVVEGGSKLIGQTIQTEVSRVFQTVAGRMVFVKPTKVK